MAKVYIAGKIKDLPQAETETKFRIAALKILANGHNPIDPFSFVKNHNEHLQLSGGVALSDNDPNQRKEILKMCISLLMGCDYIYLLHDWQNSEGATFEKQVADFFNIPVYNV